VSEHPQTYPCGSRSAEAVRGGGTWSPWNCWPGLTSRASPWANFAKTTWTAGLTRRTPSAVGDPLLP
jgi:hypothetical protein